MVNMYKHLMKFIHVVFEVYRQTDRQTDRQTHTHRGQSNYMQWCVFRGTCFAIDRMPTGQQNIGYAGMGMTKYRKGPQENTAQDRNCKRR